MAERISASIWATSGALVLCAGPAQAQLWSCDSLQAEVLEDYGVIAAGAQLACPTDTWSFDLGPVAPTAVGEVSHASDGDGTSIHLEATFTDPSGEASLSLRALGYFWLEFEEATHVSLDYDVEPVQGNAGSVAIFPYCPDQGGNFFPHAGGADFYLAPGGGCWARIEAELSLGSPGAYESNVTVGGSSSPLPVAPSLAEAIIDQHGDGTNGLSQPYGVVVDSVGNVYVTNTTPPPVVFRISPGGVISDFYSEAGGSGFGLAVDASDRVYLVSLFEDSVTRITPGGASSPIIDATGDGAGNPLSRPIDVATDASGNVYVAGNQSNNVFRITPGGAITEIIDAGGDGVHGLVAPRDVEVDAAGNVYVVGALSNNVFRIASGGAMTQLVDASGDGAGNALGSANGLAVSPDGHVYVGGATSDNVFHVSPAGVVTQLLDTTGNGSGHVCDGPQQMALDPARNLHVACWESHDVLRIAPDGTVTELMNEIGDGLTNPLRYPHGVAYADGQLYVTGWGTQNAFRIPLGPQAPLPWTVGPVLAAGILAPAVARLRRRSRPTRSP